MKKEAPLICGGAIKKTSDEKIGNPNTLRGSQKRPPIKKRHP
jgi:hypothetical protein